MSAPPRPLPPPDPALRACVVVSAGDGTGHLGRCLEALAGQAGVAPAEYEVLLALDASEAEAYVRAARAAQPELRLHVVDAPWPGGGPGRLGGMGAACARLLSLGHPDGLIVRTHAGSAPAPYWLRAQLDAFSDLSAAAGEPAAAASVAPPALRALTREPDGGDWPFAESSAALTAETYVAAGGLERWAALEDEALSQALELAGVEAEHRGEVRFWTSGRRGGPIARGRARTLAVSDWVRRRSFRAGDFSVPDLVARKQGRVSAVLPSREVVETIGAVIDALAPLVDAGLLDEVVVVDADSRDGTVEVAEARGVRVVQESSVLPEFGPARGKGDAMWRALAATDGDIVMYLDTDTGDFKPAFAVGVLGPLVHHPGIALVKGAYRRPFRLGEVVAPDQGGRVTELVARPLLNLFAPELAGFTQPLAGEIAGRRELLESMPFPVGYGVETAMLMDAARLAGIDAMAQVDLGTRQNRHQPLRALSAMAYAVLVAGLGRGLGPEALERLDPDALVLPGVEAPELRRVPIEERPPIRSLAGRLSPRVPPRSRRP